MNEKFTFQLHKSNTAKLFVIDIAITKMQQESFVFNKPWSVFHQVYQSSTPYILILNANLT